MKINLFTLPFTALVVFGTPCYASGVLTSFDALNAALATSDADVVLDMSESDGPVFGNVQISDGQSVVLSNIFAWTNPAGDGNVVTPRMISNAGTLSLTNVNVSQNELFVSSNAAGGGAVIQNTGVITDITDSSFDDNFVGSIPKNDLWGGIISNMKGATIGNISNTSFSNNYFRTAQSAPHGAIIYNSGLIEKIEDVDFYNNTMVAQANFKGGGHGVVIDNNQYSQIGKITNVRFVNNKTYKPGKNTPTGHASGGALDNYNVIEEISHTLFQGNIAQSESVNAPAMGGAIKNTFATNDGAIGLIKLIQDVDFIENGAINKGGQAYGGAYSTSYTASNSPSKVEDFQNVRFHGNYALGAYDAPEQIAAFGGAIYNYGQIDGLTGEFVDNYAENRFGRSSAQGGAIHNASAAANIKGLSASFSGNYAASSAGGAFGGAIWNAGTIYAQDSCFNNNYVVGAVGSDTDGGAIWNSGIINFVGDNVFADNWVTVGTARHSNDIYNSGTINIGDGATLNILGGISGSDGIINVGKNAMLDIHDSALVGNDIFLSDGASLSMVIADKNSIDSNTVRIDGDITLNGSSMLNVGIFFDGSESGHKTYAIANAIDVTNGGWALNQTNNVLYDVSAALTDTQDALDVSYTRKSASDISAVLGIGQSETDALLAVMQGGTTNDSFNLLSQDISYAAQSGDMSLGHSLVLLSDSADVVTTVLARHTDVITNNIPTQRLQGTNSGRSNVWARGLYQMSKDYGDMDFKTNGFGLMAGFEADITKGLSLGAGYAYAQTDIDVTGRDVALYNHSVIAYGQYSAGGWVYNAMGVYGMSKAEQSKNILSHTIDAAYDSDVFGGQLYIGHEFAGYVYRNRILITPKIGGRYYHISQDAYTDSYGMTYGATNSDILTLVAGANVLGDAGFKTISVQHAAYLNMTYDVLANGSDVLIQMPNAEQLRINSELDNDLGIELGYDLLLGFASSGTFGLGYKLNVRPDYISHTGTMTLRYAF